MPFYPLHSHIPLYTFQVVTQSAEKFIIVSMKIYSNCSYNLHIVYSLFHSFGLKSKRGLQQNRHCKIKQRIWLLCTQRHLCCNVISKLNAWALADVLLKFIRSVCIFLSERNRKKKILIQFTIFLLFCYWTNSNMLHFVVLHYFLVG